MEHKHRWQFKKSFIADGKPKVMQQLVPAIIGEPPKLKMWIDASQEYAQFVCECGALKDVPTKPNRKKEATE